MIQISLANRFLLSIIFVFSQVYLFAQNDTLEVQRDKNSKITFVRFREGSSHAPDTQFLRSLLRLGHGDSFSIVRTETDELGYTHQFYQHYFNGIKVEGSSYSVHIRFSNIQTVNGALAKITTGNISPHIDSGKALSNALRVINAKKYSWVTSKDSNYPKAELVFAPGKAETAGFVLCWKFAVAAIDPTLFENVYVDAQTGETVRKSSFICKANSTGTAATRYSGTQTITTDSYNGAFRLREVLNSVNVTTLNFQHSTDYTTTSSAIDFTDNDNNWTAAEYNDSNKDNAALDVHWASQQILNYWKSVQNRNSLDNNGLPLNNYVHFSSNYANSFWNPPNASMFYGDGDGISFYPLVSLDIIAHETGHGVCQYTCNLAGGSGEALALNEGLSDIWAAVIEHWAAPSKQMWEIGEEVMADGSPCLLSLSNPKTGGDNYKSVTGGYPTTYQGQFWDENGEPHTNSTVLSHWFYLLSVGGCGFIDDNSGNPSYSVFGITSDKAASIVYRAELYYLTSGSNYLGARTAMISAATDLYGTASNEVAQVTSAWYSVGVGAAYSGTSSPIVTSSPLCASGTFTVNNPVNSTVSWSSSNTSGLTINSTSGVATRVNSYSGQVIVSALVTGAGCNTTVTVPIWIGQPASPGSLNKNINNPPFCVGATVIANVNTVGGASTYAWASGNPSILEVSGSGTYVNLLADAAGTTYFTLTTSNACGSINKKYIAAISNCSGGGGQMMSVAVFPNPASTSLTVNVVDSTQSIASVTLPQPCQIMLFNKSGQRVYSTQSSNCTVSVPLLGLPSDLYYLNVVYREAVRQKQILIQH
ncbi:MAG: Zinc metalloproteinase precursor / aureolysin [Cytophagales bacterium]|jgi:Zn-dependent metalloprotease|nr:MAG: Zinc metalloproteinase precursor / aureolysin [Cytophagales bacterium]